MMRNQKGVTVIELAIVVAIVGIIAVATLPRFASMSETGDVNLFRSVVSEVKLAVKEGLNRGVPLNELRDPSNTTRGMPKVCQAAVEGYNNTVSVTPTTTGSLTITQVKNGVTKTSVVSITTRGDINVQSITGFNYHEVANGDIVRK